MVSADEIVSMFAHLVLFALTQAFFGIGGYFVGSHDAGLNFLVTVVALCVLLPSDAILRISLSIITYKDLVLSPASSSILATSKGQFSS